MTHQAFLGWYGVSGFEHETWNVGDPTPRAAGSPEFLSAHGVATIPRFMLECTYVRYIGTFVVYTLGARNGDW